MKIILLITIFLGSCSNIAQAQIDTTLKEYYPLEIGNHWEYWDGGEIVMTTIIGDTVMPNGNSYKVMKYRWESGAEASVYFRIDDSLNVWQFGSLDTVCNGESIGYKLTLPDSTIWTECTLFGQLPTEEYPCLANTYLQYSSVLNQICTTKAFCSAWIDTVTQDTFICSYSMNINHVQLAKGFGKIYSTGETFEWTLTGAIINGIRYGIITGLTDHKSQAEEFNVNVYPNPFNPSTTINYSIPEYSSITIKIFDILGNELEALVKAEKPAGNYKVLWNAGGLPSGVYFLRMQAGGFVQIRKMILMK